MIATEASYSGWIASRFGSSPALALAVFVNYLITGFLFQSGATEVNGINIHVLDAVFGASAGFALLLAHLLSRLLKKRSAVTNLAVWVLASILAATAPLMTILLLSQVVAPESYAQQMPIGFLSVLATCFTGTLVLAGFREGVGLRKSLRKVQGALVRQGQTVGAELSAYVDELQRPINESLERLIAQARAFLKSKATDSHEFSALILAFLGSELRPVIDTLQSPDYSAKTSLESASFSGWWRTLPETARKEVNRVAYRDSVNLFGVIVIIALYLLPASYFYEGWAGLFAQFCALVSSLAVLLAARRILGNKSSHWLVWIATNSLAFAVLMSLAGLAFAASSAAVSAMVLTFMPVAMLLMLAGSALECAIARRNKQIALLKELNERLKLAIEDLNARMLAVRRKMSRHIHNNLQSKLLNLALQTSAFDNFDPTTKAAALAALDDLTLTYELEAATEARFENTLGKLVDFWAGALEISVEVSDAAAIDANPHLRSRIVEVIREGLTNAAKYSLDAKVHLKLEKPEDGDFLLTMHNLGSSDRSRFDFGVGSQILEEFASSWSSSFDGEVFRLTARFSN